MGEKEQGTASAFRALLSVSILLLFFFVVVFIYRINELQQISATLQVITDLSSQSQRLVKLELAGETQDEAIALLDEIILELKEDDSTYGISSLNGYARSLDEVVEDWIDLKGEIALSRRTDWQETKLLYASERLFLTTDGLTEEVGLHFHEYSDSIELVQQFIVLNMTITFLLLLSQGISYLQLLQKNQEISEIMYMDLHTGLYNKSKCVDVLDRYSSLSAYPQSAVILFDLNDLKMVNDKLGHSYGDEMILAFARALKQSAQSQQPEPFLGRYGGDEFIVFFQEALEHSLEEYLTLVEHFVKISNDKTTEYEISFARGYAVSSEFQEDLSLRDLLHHADQAMYIHKTMVKEQRSKKNSAV